MARYIEVTASDGTLSRTRIDPSVNRFTVRPGDAFRFIDDNGNIPPGLVVKRYDNHLIVDGLAERGQPSQEQVSQIELVDFYGVCSVANPCRIEVREGASGAPAVFVDSSTHPIGALADGSFVLYDGAGASPTAAPLAAAGADDAAAYGQGNSQAMTWGLIGAGVLGVALAAGGGGGGSDSPTAVSPSPPAPTPGPSPTPTPTPTPAPAPAPPPGTPAPAPDTTPPQAPVISAISGDGNVTLAEKAAGLSISGTGEAGTRVDVAIGGASHTATVAATGAWTVQFTPAEIGADGTYPVIAKLTDAAGNESSLGNASFTLITVPNILVVAGDSTAGAGTATVNAAERAAGFNIVGVGPAGSPAGTDVTVTLTGGGAAITRAVKTDANNNWTAAFSPAEAIADGTYAVSAVGTIGTARGTAATAQAIIDTTPPGPPVIDPVTGDNLVTAAERATGFAITGTAEAEASVHVTIGTTTQIVTADAAGRWTSAPFASTALPATGVTATVSATAFDKAQNQGTGTTAGFILLTGLAGEILPAAEANPTLTFDALVSSHTGAAATGLGAPTAAIGTDATAIVQTLLEDPSRGNLA